MHVDPRPNGFPRPGVSVSAKIDILLICLFAASGTVALAGPMPRVREAPVVHSARSDSLNKAVPADIADLRAIEAQVAKVAERIRQSTVAIIVGESQGSGVIVTEDGLVLTAGHVVLVGGRKVTVVLPDGRRVSGNSLGVNTAGDCAVVQITDRGPFPACKISDMQSLRLGDWCLGTGHPGGYQAGRPPVVRLGRVVAMRDAFLQSDCPLLGGDSGGPLFDLAGNIIGVHSRIGPRTSLNLHVSAALFVRDWERLTKTPDAESFAAEPRGMLGVDGINDPRGEGARVTVVFPRLPADDAGLKTGDIVTMVSGHAVKDFATFQKLVRSTRPGETVQLRILRDNAVHELRATLVARPMD